MLRIQRLGMFLEAHFGEVEYHMPDEEMEDEQEGATPDGEPSFLIQLDDAEARINLLSMVHLFTPE
jgi:cleavage and polyadenylation specificity factor subunit 3